MLVVSSELRLRARLDRIGRELGLTVTFVHDLQQAIATIPTTPFDVIILGPDLVDDGLRDAILRIEAIDERAAILAVVTSEDPTTIAATFRAGAEDVLSMPLNAHELSAAIARSFGPVPIEPGLASGTRLN